LRGEEKSFTKPKEGPVEKGDECGARTHSSTPDRRKIGDKALLKGSLNHFEESRGKRTGALRGKGRKGGERKISG